MAATALVIQRTAPAAATWLPDTRERCITNVRRPPETAFFGEGHRSYISVHLDRQRSYGVAAASAAGALLPECLGLLCAQVFECRSGLECPGFLGAQVLESSSARLPGCPSARIFECSTARVPAYPSARVFECSTARVLGLRVLESSGSSAPP